MIKTYKLFPVLLKKYSANPHVGYFLNHLEFKRALLIQTPNSTTRSPIQPEKSDPNAGEKENGKNIHAKLSRDQENHADASSRRFYRSI